MTEAKRPRQPPRLDAAGKALWNRLVGSYEFDQWELAIVEACCRQADDVARLEALVASDGLVAQGSRGQPRLAPALTEIRLGRVSLARLLGELRLPSDDDVPRTAKSERSRRAANSRWTAKRLRDEKQVLRGA